MDRTGAQNCPTATGRQAVRTGPASLTGAAFAVAALAALASAAGCATRTPSTGLAAASSIDVGHESSQESRPDSELRINIEVSKTTNLFHWIDNLAGSSPAKTRRTYLKYWLHWFGPFDETDKRVLRAFRDASSYRKRGFPPSPASGSCLPGSANRLSSRQNLSVASMTAATDEELLELASNLLPKHHLAAVESGLSRFGPRFRSAWPKLRHLDSFASDLELWLARDDVRDLLRRIIRYLEADIDPEVPVTISLVALPERGPTHAEANGHHLLVEVRPGDRAEDQTPVIIHELIHDLVLRIPEQKRNRLARRFLAHGAHGNLAWKLFHEGLPTALGQGVAEERLGPRGFRVKDRWYHIDMVDRFAHGIFPSIRDELYSGRTISHRTPDHVTSYLANSSLARSKLFNFVGDAAVAASGSFYEQLSDLGQPFPSLRGWPVRWDEPSGIAFLNGFECLPIVFLATIDELDDLPPDLADSYPRAEDWLDDLPEDALGAIVPGNRPTGSPVILLAPRSAEDLNRIIEAALEIEGWLSEPEFVR